MVTASKAPRVARRWRWSVSVTRETAAGLLELGARSRSMPSQLVGAVVEELLTPAGAGGPLHAFLREQAAKGATPIGNDPDVRTMVHFTIEREVTQQFAAYADELGATAGRTLGWIVDWLLALGTPSGGGGKRAINVHFYVVAIISNSRDVAPAGKGSVLPGQLALPTVKP